MKTAFVTGAGGFLGLHLGEQLLEDNWEVIAFDLNPSRATCFETKKTQLIEGDITDAVSIENAMPEGIDAVFHLAGDTTHWKIGNERQTKINVGGTKIMVKTAMKRKARRFIYTSSIGAYGIQPGRITEDTNPTAMDSIINYWRTKFLAEQEIHTAIKQGLDAVIINPANIIGPYDKSGWARLFFLIQNGKLAGAPPGSASFCHAVEVARAHISAYKKGKKGHNYLLGGADATWLEFIQEIGRLLGKKVPKKPMPSFILHTIGRASLWLSYLTRKEPDVTPEKALLVSTDLICGSNKAKKELGFKTVPLETMLRDCHQWLVQEGLI
jgi:nucleoside-diphosphate-sugar epimerase